MLCFFAYNNQLYCSANNYSNTNTRTQLSQRSLARLSVVSFNSTIPRAQSFHIGYYWASDLPILQINSILLSSVNPSINKNDVDACCYQRTSTITVAFNTRWLMWSFTYVLRFGVTVFCYKRRPTFGVINILDSRNLLTTLDTHQSSILKPDIGWKSPFCPS